MRRKAERIFELMADSRIKEFIIEWFKCYQALYKRNPLWADAGKEAKLIQGLWLWCDKNSVDQAGLYGAVLKYFNDETDFVVESAHSFEIFYKCINKYLEPKKASKEEKIIQQARDLFVSTQKRFEKIYTITPKSDQDLLEVFTKYPKTHDGCLEWTKKVQRFQMKHLSLIPGGQSHSVWVRNGKLGRQYFGSELVDQCWQETSGQSQEKIANYT